MLSHDEVSRPQQVPRVDGEEEDAGGDGGDDSGVVLLAAVGDVDDLDSTNCDWTKECEKTVFRSIQYSVIVHPR